MTLAEVEKTYIDDLNMLEDWFLQYEYLLEISSDLPKFSDQEKTDANKVKGCQSGVWLNLSNDDDIVHVQADSDALIIRGILAIIVGIFDGQSKAEIDSFEPSFIEKTNIKNQISTDRFNGINSVISTIKNYAKAIQDMDSEKRRAIVTRLLKAAKEGADEEAQTILNGNNSDYAFVYQHIRNYILKKYVLSPEEPEENLKALAVISLSKMMKIDSSVLREIDLATPCDKATSESTKTALLLYSIQRDLNLPSNPREYAAVETIPELARYIVKYINH